MVNRMSLNLGTARSDSIYIMRRWKYLFVGDCDGDVTIKLGSLSASPLDPNEFDKLTGIEEFNFLYITNTAQTGKVLNIYFEEEELTDVDIKTE